MHEGKTVQGHVRKGLIKYYTFNINSEDAVIDITLTPLDEGNPDMIVEKGAGKRPSEAVFRWV